MDTFTGEKAEVTPKGNDADLRQYTRILTVGISVLIDLHPKTPATSRHRAILLGWDEGRVLLFEPNAGENSTCFREGDRCQVRFVQDGQIWGFYSHLKSNVQDRVGFMIEVEWPESVSKVRLRRHERVDIALPCRLFLEDGSQISAPLAGSQRRRVPAANCFAFE
jgi:c-di-GMP-binding flagellar brake protein YcgR